MPKSLNYDIPWETIQNIYLPKGMHPNDEKEIRAEGKM